MSDVDVRMNYAAVLNRLSSIRSRVEDEIANLDFLYKEAKDAKLIEEIDATREALQGIADDISSEEPNPNDEED